MWVAYAHSTYENLALLPCAYIEVGGNLTNKYRGKVCKTVIFCSMSAHSFHPE